MRTKKPFLIALFLCTWTFLSYYLLIRQSDSGNTGSHHINGLTYSSHRDDLFRQLNRLESNIQEENLIHDQLVKKLIEIVRLKEDGHGKSATIKNQSINNNPNGIPNYGKDINRLTGALSPPDIKNDNEFLSSTEIALNDIDAPIINKLKELKNRKHDIKGPIIPVLVFACNRISVRNCLDDLVRYRPNSYQFPIIVSQVSFSLFIFHIFSHRNNLEFIPTEKKASLNATFH